MIYINFNKVRRRLFSKLTHIFDILLVGPTPIFSSRATTPSPLFYYKPNPHTELPHIKHNKKHNYKLYINIIY